MAKMVLKSSYLSLAATDWSANTAKIELKAEVEDKDVTTFGSLGWKESLTGIFKAGLSVGFKNDYAAAGFDSVMWAAFIAGAAIAFEVRATSAAVGTSNPKYTGSLLLVEWSPISGNVGDEASLDVTWPITGVLARATS